MDQLHRLHGIQPGQHGLHWLCLPNLEALEGYPAYYEETYGEPLDEERYEIMAAPDDVLARCELYTNLPSDTLTLYNDLWTELGI